MRQHVVRVCRQTRNSNFCAKTHFLPTYVGVASIVAKKCDITPQTFVCNFVFLCMFALSSFFHAFFQTFCL